jgi:hypothetical protein
LSSSSGGDSDTALIPIVKKKSAPSHTAPKIKIVEKKVEQVEEKESNSDSSSSSSSSSSESEVEEEIIKRKEPEAKRDHENLGRDMQIANPSLSKHKKKQVWHNMIDSRLQ